MIRVIFGLVAHEEVIHCGGEGCESCVVVPPAWGMFGGGISVL